MFINAILQKYPELKRPEALFEISNILESENEVKDLEGDNMIGIRRRGNSNLKNTKIKPPFSQCWYEGKISNNRTAMGFLLSENKNILECNLYQITIRGVEFVASQQIVMDESFIIPMGTYANLKINTDIVTESDDVYVAFNTLFYSVHYVNALLNCKNVSTDSHDFPNRRSIHHYKRIGKPYFEKYYTLKLEVPGNKKRSENKKDIETDGYNRAFHICRGHFKIYTEANPLFGKYTGTYWWNSQVRGDIETGIIDKDYSLKQSNNNVL